MDPDNFGETLFMAFIELKLDPTTMRDWQGSTWENRKVPLFEDMLDFLDLHVHDTKNSVCDIVKKHPTASNPGNTARSYTASVEDGCVECKKNNHPLYGWKALIASSPDKRMELVRDSCLCINCLKSGHMAKQCPSSQKCKKYRGSRYSLLHKD